MKARRLVRIMKDFVLQAKALEWTTIVYLCCVGISGIAVILLVVLTWLAVFVVTVDWLVETVWNVCAA